MQADDSRSQRRRNIMRVAIAACALLAVVYIASSHRASASTNELEPSDTNAIDFSAHPAETTDLHESRHRRRKEGARSDRRNQPERTPTVPTPRQEDYRHGPGHGNRESGMNDENIFDEAHQRSIVQMYGEDKREEPIQQDPLNPYSFPGMTPNEGPGDWDYAITIDCGSKGSRIHIYKFQHRHSPTSIPPFSPIFTKHAWSQKVTPGISDFVDSPELVLPTIERLLEFARNSLSAFRYKWNRTPVYLKATAGMRLIKNLPSRDRIMETIRTHLSDPSKNPFYFERTMARVISGEEEGVYGWITTNYLSGTLVHASSATSFGALDMGGASVQITFRPPFDVLSNYFPLRIQQEKIRLYSHSFLNFGIERALQRVNDRLIELGGNGTWLADDPTSSMKQQPGSFFLGMRDGVRVFRHPCFPLGFSFTYLYIQNLDLAASYSGTRQPFTASYGDDEESLGADMAPITTYSEEHSKREMVQFEGSQDFANCSILTWQLLHKKGACFDNTCSFDGIYQPRFGNVTFLAFSEFSKVVTGDLGLPKNATLGDIDRQTRIICKYNWQKLQDLHRYASIDDLSKMCFNARYVFTVLYKGFGFPYEGHNLLFVRTILDLDLSWALGSTLYEANAMPFDIDGPRKGEETFRYQIGEKIEQQQQAGPEVDKSSHHRHGHDHHRISRHEQSSSHFSPYHTSSKGGDDSGDRSHLDESHNPHLDRDDSTSSYYNNHPSYSNSAAPSSHNTHPGKVHAIRKTKRGFDQVAKQYGTEAEDEQQHEREHEREEQERQEREEEERQSSTHSRHHSSDCNHHDPNVWKYPSVWGIVGFLSGGWIMTLIALLYSMLRVRRMEASGMRYEPIQEAAA